MMAVRRMDPLSLVAERCTNSGHTSAFQNAEILGRGKDRVTKETMEAWHIGTNSINRCVSPGSMGDTNAAALSLGSGEGAIFTTAAAPTYPAGEKKDGRSNINGPGEGASVTATYPAGENTGRRGVVKKIDSLGQELRSMRTCAMTASARTSAPDER